MKFRIFQDTRIGKRPYQQDRFGHWSTGDALFLAVADGMGGHTNGEIAAQVTIDCLGAGFRAEATPRIADAEPFLLRSIARAHAMIGRETQRQRLPEAPRTTVVACLIQDGYARWSFVGDSRLYLVRGGRVVTRTRDHTPVQRLIDMGRIREEAAMTHPDRNKLLQCLGGPRPPEPERPESARLDQGDLVILCSDGFWGPLTQRQLLMGLIGKDMPVALAELAAQSETLAGPRCDNITVLAAEWQEKGVPVVEDATVPIHQKLDSKP